MKPLPKPSCPYGYTKTEVVHLIRFIKEVLQVIVLALTALALVFVIVWGFRVESVIDKLNDPPKMPDAPSPVEPAPDPSYPLDY
jgi:hypothetical protein